MEIVSREFASKRSEILLKAMQLRGARNGHYPPLLCQQPGKRDLCRCRLLARCYIAYEIDQRHVRLHRSRGKTGNRVAEIRTVEFGVLVDFAREEACTQRTEANKANTQFF